MVQLPSAPSDSGNSRPAAAAASCARASTTPASQVMVFEVGSTSRMRSSRLSDSTISPLSGVWPPTRPVLPPCGTIGGSGLVGQLQDGGDLLGRARPQHQRRAAVIEPALLGDVGRDLGRLGHRVACADDRGETSEQVGIELLLLRSAGWRRKGAAVTQASMIGCGRTRYHSRAIAGTEFHGALQPRGACGRAAAGH